MEITNEIIEIIEAARIEGFNAEELANLLGISEKELKKESKSNKEFAVLLKNASLEVRVRITKALIKMAEGYYIDEVKYVVDDKGNKKPVRYERKWIPPDLKVATKLLQILNPNTKFNDNKTVVHKIEVTIDNKKLPKSNEIKADYVLEG